MEIMAITIKESTRSSVKTYYFFDIDEKKLIINELYYLNTWSEEIESSNRRVIENINGCKFFDYMGFMNKEGILDDIDFDY